MASEKVTCRKAAYNSEINEDMKILQKDRLQSLLEAETTMQRRIKQKNQIRDELERQIAANKRIRHIEKMKMAEEF